MEPSYEVINLHDGLEISSMNAGKLINREKLCIDDVEDDDVTESE